MCGLICGKPAMNSGDVFSNFYQYISVFNVKCRFIHLTHKNCEL